MAEPNLINTTSCLVESSKFNLSNTATVLVGSKVTVGNPYLNKSIKIVSCYFANITSSTATVTVQLNNPGNVSRYLGYQIAVPAKATLVLITKDSPVYLEEYDTLEAFSTGQNIIHAITSFEIYDDA